MSRDYKCGECGKKWRKSRGHRKGKCTCGGKVVKISQKGLGEFDN